jgi:hypothetical protein
MLNLRERQKELVVCDELFFYVGGRGGAPQAARFSFFSVPWELPMNFRFV